MLSNHPTRKCNSQGQREKSVDKNFEVGLCFFDAQDMSQPTIAQYHFGEAPNNDLGRQPNNQHHQEKFQ